MRPPLLIVGGSTRAAAWSAIRAGFRPICADGFADDDLRAVAEVLPLERYPRDVLRAARSVPPDVPWMYTGGMENHPRLIAALSAQRPLLGNSADSVKAVRDLCAAVWKDLARFRPKGLVGIPACRAADDPPPANGEWMLKPLRGSAGRGISVWSAGARNHPTLRAPHLFQKRMAGLPVSALFVARQDGASLLGFSRQWIGDPVCHARPFQYCGSIAEMAVADDLFNDVHSLGASLALRFDLRGLFGCDFLLDGETAWLTEVNPRYTASVEAFEFAGMGPLLARHAAACGAPRAGDSPAACSRSVGKAILYAPREIVVGALPLPLFDGSLPEIADVPRAGSVIPAGAPICTVFAAAESERECEVALREKLSHWSRNLCGPVVQES